MEQPENVTKIEFWLPKSFWTTVTTWRAYTVRPWVIWFCKQSMKQTFHLGYINSKKVKVSMNGKRENAKMKVEINQTDHHLLAMVR